MTQYALPNKILSSSPKVWVAFVLLLLTTLGSIGSRAQDINAITSNTDLFPAMGPFMARNVVIEFADFQCPYCAMSAGLAPWIDEYADRYGPLIGSGKYIQELAEQNKIRFIYAPLSFLDKGDNKESTWATQAAFCAQDQDKFWEMHDAIFTATDSAKENTGKYSKENLKNLAANIEGIDTSGFNTCLDSDATLDKTQQVMKTFVGAGFKVSTPQFWVNGKKVEPLTESLKQALGM